LGTRKRAGGGSPTRGDAGALLGDTFDPIYAARAIFPHLAGREVRLDARKTFGVRRFSSNLPGHFGLRAAMGRLPEGRPRSFDSVR
jgi:hypothetical protein